MKNQGLVRTLVYILFIFLLLGFTKTSLAKQNSGRASADSLQQDDPPPLPDISNYTGTAQFTFAQLGVESFELRSPISRQIAQSFPYRWIIRGGIESSYIDIHYDMVVLDSDQFSLIGRSGSLPSLEVYVDDIFAGAITPQPGNNQLARIPIPVEAVINASNNRHRINFIYFRGENCIDEDADTMLFIYNDSTVNISYNLAKAELNLADFPRPLIQESFIPETLNIVIPDNFSEHDLSVASVVAASIGNRTSSKPVINMLTATQVTSEVLFGSNAIIIGEPDTNAFLAQLYANSGSMPPSQSLPTSLSSDGATIIGINNQIIEPGDGVLQLIRSPINVDDTFLIVTSDSPEGLMKAAKTLSGASPVLGLESNLAVIAEFLEPPTSDNENLSMTFSLGEFGMRDTTYFFIGRRSISVSFFVPQNWSIQDGAALILAYVHSAQLEQNNSSITVKLNENPIGSAQIDQSNQGEKLALIPIRPGDIRPGQKNRLTFDSFVNVAQSCAVLNPQSIWLRIRDTSLIHLPYDPVSFSEDSSTFTHPFFPLISDTGMNKVWIALPPEPNPSEINGLIQLAYLMGGELQQPNLEFMVTMSSDPSPENYQDFNIVAFGKHTSNPLIGIVNETLPQPFMTGEDTIQQNIGNTIFQLPPDIDLGLIEVIPSPWNPTKAITVVSGTTDVGLTWAIDTFTNGDLIGDLDGDISLIRGETIEVINSKIANPNSLARSLIDFTQIEDLIESLDPSNADSAPPLSNGIPEQYRPQKASPPISVILMYVLVGIGVLLAFRGIRKNIRKPRKQETTTGKKKGVK